MVDSSEKQARCRTPGESPQGQIDLQSNKGVDSEKISERWLYVNPAGQKPSTEVGVGLVWIDDPKIYDYGTERPKWNGHGSVGLRLLEQLAVPDLPKI